MNLKILCPALLLAVAGCATMNRNADADPGAPPPVDLADARVAVHTEKNGDVIEEYRVGTQLRMVKVTPANGPAYYLYDSDGDGRIDKSKGDREVPAVYWKLFSW